MAGKGTRGSRRVSSPRRVSRVSSRGQLARNVAYQTWHLLRGGLVYGALLYASVTLSQPITGAVNTRLQMSSPTSFMVGHGFFTLLLFTLSYLLMTFMYKVVYSSKRFSFSRRGKPIPTKKTRSGKAYGHA